MQNAFWKCFVIANLLNSSIMLFENKYWRYVYCFSNKETASKYFGIFEKQKGRPDYYFKEASVTLDQFSPWIRW